MKIAIVYNRDSQAVINLFGVPNRETYGLKTIKKVRDALKAGGRQVKVFEGDKHLVKNLEEFMPAVISGERPGLVFNLSYGIQGAARYTHVPAMLEMLGIPYVGSGPETHAIALDKVVTKIILARHGLPTPRFALVDSPDSNLSEHLDYPLIVKPRDEAVSFGLRVVRDEGELREGVRNIYETFRSPTLVEEYIDGREINVALLGNDPVEALPPVELRFGKGVPIYTYEDKTHRSGREIRKICPPRIPGKLSDRMQEMAIASFKALGCYDSARVDFRIDRNKNPYILEVNSMASLGPGGTFVFAAEKVGLEYTALANRLIEITGRRYFGPGFTSRVSRKSGTREQGIFSYLTMNRDRSEKELKLWTNRHTRTGDVAGVNSISRRLGERLSGLGLSLVDSCSSRTSAWTFETRSGFEGGTLLVFPLDVQDVSGSYPVYFRREPEWLYGEGIASSRSGMACALRALDAMRSVKKLGSARVGVFAYSDEGQDMRFSRTFLKAASERARQVIVLQPGYREGRVVTQRRGIRKIKIIVEGKPLRVGYRGTEIEVLPWFLKKIGDIAGLSRPAEKFTVRVLDIQSERFGVLSPHKVSAVASITYLDREKAGRAESGIRELFASETRQVRAHVEEISDRPPFLRTKGNKDLIRRLESFCDDWKLPFGVETSLLPSPAGEISGNTQVVCGLGPACRDIFTPQEAVHRGEFIQRTLLLSLFLLGE